MSASSLDQSATQYDAIALVRKVEGCGCLEAKNRNAKVWFGKLLSEEVFRHNFSFAHSAIWEVYQLSVRRLNSADSEQCALDRLFEIRNKNPDYDFFDCVATLKRMG